MDIVDQVKRDTKIIAHIGSSGSYAATEAVTDLVKTWSNQAASTEDMVRDVNESIRELIGLKVRLEAYQKTGKWVDAESPAAFRLSEQLMRSLESANTNLAPRDLSTNTF